MDERNKYVDDKAVKWIVAQRKLNGKWQIRFISLLERNPTLDRVLDETQIHDMKVSEFAVFKNRMDWWTYSPRRHYRGCDVPVSFKSVVGTLINMLPSNYF